MAPIAAANPLVSRGIADLAQMQESPSAENSPMSRLSRKLPEDLQKLADGLRQRCRAHAAGLRALQGLLRKKYDKGTKEYEEAIRLVLALHPAELLLTRRSRMCLKRLGINSLGDLISRTGDELLESKNFGMICLTEVRAKLRLLGLVLRGD